MADWFCPDRSAAWDKMKSEMVGTLKAKKSLLYGTEDVADEVRWSKWYFRPTQPAGLYGLNPKHGYSGVYVPGKTCIDCSVEYTLDRFNSHIIKCLLDLRIINIFDLRIINIFN